MRGTRRRSRDRQRSRRFSPAHAGNTRSPSPSPVETTVQPRACGEHAARMRGKSSLIGSAPRMRGTRRRRDRAAATDRFSPAHAGNTSAIVRNGSTGPVQPRACGEHRSATPWMTPESGSAPRMRGTLRQGQARHPVRRFSPAHAGNTRRATDEIDRRAVQPRACGEHHRVPAGACRMIGSAPRMRGTRPTISTDILSFRFSPAHAGNTSAFLVHLPGRTVQPRACGEHAARSWLRCTALGSAPRMRGTLLGGERGERRRRFSPAHAGNTRARTRACFPSPVQPRACGEHIQRVARASAPLGSAPRMRGTRQPRGIPPSSPRFSPAHAGNTHPVRSHLVEAAVQPRACGEHRDPTAQGNEDRGSAPRMRGTRTSLAIGNDNVRFSPAHAGNTDHVVGPQA